MNLIGSTHEVRWSGIKITHRIAAAAPGKVFCAEHFIVRSRRDPGIHQKPASPIESRLFRAEQQFTLSGPRRQKDARFSSNACPPHSTERSLDAIEAVRSNKQQAALHIPLCSAQNSLTCQTLRCFRVSSC
jgi:hypothetical protein